MQNVFIGATKERTPSRQGTPARSRSLTPKSGRIMELEEENARSLLALPKNKILRKQEQVNQKFRNAYFKERSDFTSEENFKQFQLLKNDCSWDNIDLAEKFVAAASEAGTITQEERYIFHDCIMMQYVELERNIYAKEEIGIQDDLEHAKFIEGLDADLKEIKILRKKREEKQKKEEEEMRKGIVYRIWNWLYWPFAKEKEEDLNQKDMDEKEKKLELEEKKK